MTDELPDEPDEETPYEETPHETTDKQVTPRNFQIGELCADVLAYVSRPSPPIAGAKQPWRHVGDEQVQELGDLISRIIELKFPSSDRSGNCPIDGRFWATTEEEMPSYRSLRIIDECESVDTQALLKLDNVEVAAQNLSLSVEILNHSAVEVATDLSKLTAGAILPYWDLVTDRILKDAPEVLLPRWQKITERLCGVDDNLASKLVGIREIVDTCFAPVTFVVVEMDADGLAGVTGFETQDAATEYAVAAIKTKLDGDDAEIRDHFTEHDDFCDDDLEFYIAGLSRVIPVGASNRPVATVPAASKVADEQLQSRAFRILGSTAVVEVREASCDGPGDVDVFSVTIYERMTDAIKDICEMSSVPLYGQEYLDLVNHVDRHGFYFDNKISKFFVSTPHLVCAQSQTPREHDANSSTDRAAAPSEDQGSSSGGV